MESLICLIHSYDGTTFFRGRSSYSLTGETEQVPQSLQTGTYTYSAVPISGVQIRGSSLYTVCEDSYAVLLYVYPLQPLTFQYLEDQIARSTGLIMYVRTR